MSDESAGRKRSAAELGENEEEEEEEEEDASLSLREQLQQKDQRKQELLELITSKDELIAAEKQLIAAEKQREKQLDQKIQQLQQEIQQLKREKQLRQRVENFEKNSIYALLKREKSGDKKQGLFTFTCHGNDTFHTTSNAHLPAITESVDFILKPDALIEEMKDQLTLETSLLMTKLDRCGVTVPFQSQADISHYVSLALSDAMWMVSLIKKIKLYSLHEQSIFSQRPDHVVVYDAESNLPIIAVEHTIPAPSGICTDNTAGKVFDYAVSMQSFGHKAPFVVLSSLEQTVVTWLDEALPRALAAGHGRIDAVSTDGSLPSVERAASALDQADETPWPPSTINGDARPKGQSLLKRQAPSGSQQLVFEANAERKLCRSTSAYNSSQLTRVLYSVIVCGLQGLDRSSSAKSITRFTPPLAGEAKCCLELSEDSYSWGTISSNRKPCTRSSASLKKKYYVVGVIGSGYTSKVFHAVDLDCKEYVIKMYVQRFAGNTFLSNQDFEEKGRLSVTTEVENFKLIYPELNVVGKKLNNHHCVIMPFFHPVPKDEREVFIEKIEKVLMVFALNKLKYKDGDIHWQHVGLYEGKCILYDLADLEASTSKRFVPQHVEEFKRRANVFSRSRGPTFFVNMEKVENPTTL